MSRRLILGPREANNNTQTGGVVVLFEEYIHWINSEGINTKIIDTNRSNYPNAFKYLVSVYKTLLTIKKYDIVELHATYSDMILIAPMLYLFLKEKKLVIRKFAGDFEQRYSKSGFITKCILRAVIKNSSLCFFETKSLVKRFQQINRNTYWFPNVRTRLEDNLEIKEYKKRLVFFSQIKRSKGILDLISAMAILGNDYSLDIFGPVVDNTINITQLNGENFKYHGSLAPSLAQRTIAAHDVLVLPSYHPGEGYPGVIIESKAVGVPVVASWHGGIPEIVNHNTDGILIPSQDVNAICMALQKIESNYENMCEMAYLSFEQFDSKQTHHRVNNMIINV